MMMLAAIYFKAQNPLHDVDNDQPEFNYHVVLMTQSSSPISILKDIHHRMPVMLKPEALMMWLDMKKHPFKDCRDAIEKQDVSDDLEAYEVSDLVNSIKNEGEELILPRKNQKDLSIQRGIGRFFAPISKK